MGGLGPASARFDIRTDRLKIEDLGACQWPGRTRRSDKQIRICIGLGEGIALRACTPIASGRRPRPGFRCPRRPG